MTEVLQTTDSGYQRILMDNGQVRHRNLNNVFVSREKFEREARPDTLYRTLVSTGTSSGESNSRVEVIAWYVDRERMSDALVRAVEGYHDDVLRQVQRELPTLAIGLERAERNTEENVEVEGDELRKREEVQEPQNVVVVDNGRGSTYEYSVQVGGAFGENVTGVT
jgi:hypothetical protein